jgi:hypothetical protein
LSSTTHYTILVEVHGKPKIYEHRLPLNGELYKVGVDGGKIGAFEPKERGWYREGTNTIDAWFREMAMLVGEY